MIIVLDRAERRLACLGFVNDRNQDYGGFKMDKRQLLSHLNARSLWAVENISNISSRHLGVYMQR